MGDSRAPAHLTLGGYLVAALEAEGVQHVFGIPGVHNLELYRGLHSSRIRHVTGRHEQGLGFMADGYARASGRPAVCFTVSGPGVTNIATAMAQAYGDSIPMLVVSSALRAGDAASGRGFLHEMQGQLQLAKLVAGAAEHVASPAQLPDALHRTFAALTEQRPRPAYLEIPVDVLNADSSALPTYAPRPKSVRGGDAAAIAAAAKLLASARSPIVVAGGGAVGCKAELTALCEKLDAPLVMTANARGLLPPDHPLAIAISPSLGFVRAAIAAADVVLAVGTELGPTDFDIFEQGALAQPQQLVRIDLDAAQMERNAKADVALVGDATLILRALLATELPVRPPGRGAAVASDVRATLLGGAPPRFHRRIAFLETIRDEVPNVTIVGDSTQPVYTGNIGFAASRPRSWFSSATGFGTLGYALPAATGVSVATPDRPVVCLIGDGGIQFTLGELGVLREVNAWCAIVVWNNRGYAEIRATMSDREISLIGVDLAPPEFELIAQAYGYAYRVVDGPEAMKRAMADFAARRQVVLIEVHADKID